MVTCILLWSHPSPSGFGIDALLGTNAGGFTALIAHYATAVVDGPALADEAK
jgi:hypothetical protein